MSGKLASDVSSSDITVKDIFSCTSVASRFGEIVYLLGTCSAPYEIEYFFCNVPCSVIFLR